MEDVGVRFITQGEKEFMGALMKAQTAAVAMGNAIYDAAKEAARAMIEFASSSIQAASDLNETVSKAGVVFGKYSFIVTEWGRNSAASMGMSSNAAIGAAATYGNLFRSMGMTDQASSKMSMNLVQLASDLASFNNLSPEDVLEKLRAGLTGESEPLKSLGININEDIIKAEAFKMGLVKLGGELTPLTKAQAVYNLMLKQTSLAQGDFARTADGLANQQRIFAANIENTKAALGTALLPIINKVMGALNKLFNSPGFQEGIKNFMATISKVGDFLGVLFDDILGGDAGLAFDDFREGLYKLFPPEMEGIITTFNNALGTVYTFISAIVGYIQDQGITTIGDFFYAFANGLFSISGGTGILQEIGGALFVVGDTVNSVMAWIQSTIQTGLAAIQGWWAANGASITASVQTMWAGVSKMFDAAITFIQTLVSFVLTNLNVFWQAHGDKVIAVVNWLWTTVQTIFNTAVSIITSIFQAFTSALQGDWQGFGDHLLEAWNTLWALIKSTAEAAWALLSEWFMSVIQQILNFFKNTDWGRIGRNIIDGIWSSLKDGWGRLTSLIQDLANKLWEAAKRALGIQSPSTVFYDIGENMMKGWGAGIAKNAMIPITATVQAAVMSAGAAMAAPSTINQTNNYNLQVITNQSPAVVGQSFAVMQLLAG